MRKHPKSGRFSRIAQFLFGAKLVVELVNAGIWCWDNWK